MKCDNCGKRIKILYNNGDTYITNCIHCGITVVFIDEQVNVLIKRADKNNKAYVRVTND